LPGDISHRGGGLDSREKLVTSQGLTGGGPASERTPPGDSGEERGGAQRPP
jgi:hypothetical protein